MALPPWDQRQKEISTILSSADVQDRLLGQPVDSIVRNAEDVYELAAGNLALTIHVRTLPDAPGHPALPGPRRFHLVLGEARTRAR